MATPGDRIPKRIAVCDTGYENYDVERRIATEAGYAFDVFPGEQGNRASRLAFCKGAAGLLIRHTLVDAAFMDEIPTLEAVVRYGVGYENVDVAEATKRGIKVAIIKGYGSSTVAEHALALALACSRALVLGLGSRDGRFSKAPRADLMHLGDKTLGIVGLGRIGGALCEKAQSIFGGVVACDPYIPAERFRTLRAAPVTLSELLERSDVISLHCNLTEETTHLLDTAAFSQMARKPIVVNAARGPVIDENALLQALRNERIHSAGIDVYEQEPPATAAARALVNHPHVIATGHYAYYSPESIQTLQRRAALDVVALLNGETLSDCLNP